MQHRLKTELFSVATKHIYIYTTIGVCERDQREKTRQDYSIIRLPAHYNRSEHSDNSHSHGSNDGLKLSFLVFKALKTKMDNFSVGAFVRANNKENLNMDGCLWYFGGISSSLKAICFGHTNKKSTSVSGVLQNGQFISLSGRAVHRVSLICQPDIRGHEAPHRHLGSVQNLTT